MTTPGIPRSYVAPMKKIVLTFGLISGLILASMMGISLLLLRQGAIDFDSGTILGYSTMVLSFLLVFFGIRSYRDNVAGGTITFGKAFLTGLLIMLIACVMYVAAWELIYINFLPDFYEKYTAHAIEKLRAGGASAAKIAATQKEMSDFKKLYDNPFLNAAFTFLEPLPVGLIMTLISAAILRRKPGPIAPATALA